MATPFNESDDNTNILILSCAYIWRLTSVNCNDLDNTNGSFTVELSLITPPLIPPDKWKALPCGISADNTLQRESPLQIDTSGRTSKTRRWTPRWNYFILMSVPGIFCTSSNVFHFKSIRFSSSWNFYPKTWLNKTTSFASPKQSYVALMVHYCHEV